MMEVPDMFADRKARCEAKKTLAQSLKTSVKRVNRMKLCDKPLESVMNREKKAKKAAEHREKCTIFAKKVLNKEISRKRAAEACHISERQMARHIAKAAKGESQ